MSMLALTVIATAISVGTIVVRTGTNAVTAKRAAERSSATTANTLKPAACNAITLTAKLSGAISITGTNASELIVASEAADVIDGGAGNDCIVAGGGNDLLIRGGAGTDVCIGGPGTDTFHSSCETQIQ